MESVQPRLNSQSKIPEGYYQRLMITKIELENFKSYFGKKVIGPLHKNFTAVVGPNGSGKSNLIESLLFVFGKRAKQMRLNKLSELIHKSAEYGDCQTASVRVFFTDIVDKEDDPDQYQEIPGTQFTVARIVTRSSTSKYFINNNVVDYKDVCTLLMDKGIDLDHNRFLILQGEVEQISLMKPKGSNPQDQGLLEYLEEIIGSQVYVEQIEELSKILEEANERRIEATNRAKASQTELGNLEGERQKALNFLKSERKYLKLQNLRFFVELGDSVKQYNELGKQVTDTREQLRIQKEKKRDMFTQNGALVTEINNLHSQQEQADRRMKELQRDFEVLERADLVVNNEKKHKINDISKCEKKIKELQEEKVQNVERIAKINQEMPELEHELKQLCIQRQDAERIYELEDMKVRQMTEQLRQKKEQIEQPLQQLQAQLKQIKITADGKRAEIESTQSRKDKINGDFERHQGQFGNYEQKLQKAQKLQDEFNDDLKLNKDMFVSLKEREQQLRIQIKKNLEKENNLQEKLNEMNNYMKHAKMEDSILKNLKEAQRLGKISGVHGRLGDLGTVDALYDTATSTACGLLDVILVETVQDGEQCIQYLKDNRLGRGNFICLDKITQQLTGFKDQFQAPENTHRLFEMIRPNDPKFEVAFYFALRNTLVCNDLQQAQKVAFGPQRHRVVTLNGILIESHGTLTGGGKPKSGGMSATRKEEFTQDQIDQVANQIETLKNQTLQSKQDLKTCETEQLDVNKKISETQRKLEKANIEVRTYKEVLDQSQEKLVHLTAEKQKLEAEFNKIDVIKQEIEGAVAQAAALNPQIEQLKKDLAVNDGQIMDVGGQEYKNLKNNLEKLTKQVAEVERTLTRNKTTLGSNESVQKKIESDVQKMQEEINRLNRAKTELQQEIEKNDLAGQRLVMDMKACEQVKKDCDIRLEARKKDFSEMKKNIDVINLEESKLKDKLDGITGERDVYKTKCDKIKSNVKINRENFKRSVEEFGIDLDNDQIITDDRTSQMNSQVTIRQDSFRSIQDQAQGFEYFLQNKEITYTYSDQEIVILTAQKHEIERELKNVKSGMDQISPNVQILAHYRQKKAEHQTRAAHLKSLEQNLAQKRLEYDDLKDRRHKQFKSGFDLIATHVKQIYRLITNGGDADLETIDQLDPFSEGVLFQVRPKNKSWKHMSKLSGGEKTLASLSLIFALHIFKPSPLYCMDEIDAALDYKNVAVVGKYIKEGVCKQGSAAIAQAAGGARARASQFLIISLRNNMFELSDTLVGIYKTHDVTKTVCVNPKFLIDQVQQQRVN